MTALACLFFFLPFLLADDSVRIIQPPSLYNQFPPYGMVPERPALFGVPPFGRTIAGLLVYATPNSDGCSTINRTAISNWPAQGTPVVLMLDRGDCTFVTKVRNAQIAGAQAVIVVDNVAETNLPYMADDGTGADITIPSVLIYQSDGAKIKNYVASSVIVSLSWDIPSPDDRVEWTLWTSSHDDQSVQFKAVFGTAVRALNESAQFTPHYLIINGTSYNCTAPGLPCGSQCTNSGRYCAIDPNGDLDSGLNGEDIVSENLRQICIFQEMNQTNVPWLWWDYVSSFQTNCAGSKATWNTQCANNILTSLGVNTTNVTNCIASSGGTDHTGGPNWRLDNETAALLLDGVFMLPTVIINQAAYRGSMSCPVPIQTTSCGVLQAICSGYPDDALPCACTSSPGCALCEYRDACGVCGGNGMIDACGQCLPVNSSAFNQSCMGCDGIPNSGKKNDPCSVCGGNGSVDACGRCLQANDPLRVAPGEGGPDACGVCLKYTDSRFNQSCLGCDGVPNSGVERDACGECGGTKTAADCPSSPMSVTTIILIVVVCVVVVAVCVFIYMKRQQAKLRDDIDHLLAQYQPLEGAQGLLPTTDPMDKRPQAVPMAAPVADRTDEDEVGQLMGSNPHSDT